MNISFPRFSLPWMGRKEKAGVPNGSLVNPLNSLGEWGLGLRGEADRLNLNSSKVDDRRVPSAKVRRKWKSREERYGKMDREHDIVVVPSDGVCLSGSESDDSDWSIGWLEPHPPGFWNDGEDDDSFAVLVPCYKQKGLEKEESSSPFFTDVKNLPTDFSAEGKEHMIRWLSSLQNF